MFNAWDKSVLSAILISKPIDLSVTIDNFREYFLNLERNSWVKIIRNVPRQYNLEIICIWI